MKKNTVIPFQKNEVLTPNDAMDQLFEIFEDKYPVLVAEDQDKWYFQLDWPTDKNWYVDPDLFTINYEDLGFSTDIHDHCKQYEYNQGRILVSALHSKAILGISEMINFPTKIDTIVHIDDHSDLMAPLLYLHDDTIRTSLFAGSIHLNDTGQMEQCIERGVFGIGSYLSAFVLMTNPGFIYHIKQSPEVISSATYSLDPRMEFQNVGGTLIKRTALDKKDMLESDRLWKYRQISDFEEINNTAENVWLDIDLDYFSNRYDRDSDWTKKNTLNPIKGELVKLMQDTFLKITKSQWVKNVRFVSISYSPGFFPSEYFQEAQHFFIQPLISHFKGGGSQGV